MNFASRLITGFLLTITIAACQDRGDAETRTADVMLSDINIIDVESGAIIANQDVFITGTRITDISPHGQLQMEADRVLDGSGRYVMPGLWDMHAHVRSWSQDDNFPMYVVYGVTGIRDLGLTNHDLIKHWQGQIAAGDIVGPRIISSGVIIEGAEPRFPSSVSISILEEVQPKLDALIAADAEIVKVFQNIPGDVFDAIIQYSHKNGLVTSGHIPDGWTQLQAARTGMGSIEHMFGIGATLKDYGTNSYTDEEIDALAEALVANNVFQSPTMVNLEYFVKLGDAHNNPARAAELFETDPKLAFAPAYFKAWWAGIRTRNMENFDAEDYARFSERLALNGRILHDLHDRGVKILAGTDVPNPYILVGTSLHDELGLFVKAGLSPADALKTATLYPAQYFKRDGEFGVVKPGAFADLVVVDKNPLEDINNTRSIHAVMTNGRLFDHSELDALRKAQLERLGPYAETDFDQYIYMDVRRNGIAAVREKYPDLQDNDDYIIRPHHLLRLSNTLRKGLQPGESHLALEWNMALFPDDAATCEELNRPE